MRYDGIVEGVFVSRPNRFVAVCTIDGVDVVCHVKNTGRCQEILIPGATVYLQKSDSPKRSTAYDLIAVMKGNRLVNIDSQAPNAVAEESLRSIGLADDFDLIRREYVHGDSRFDIYAESGDRRFLVEVKGVTLEDDGVVLFPDAPTERGLKHVRGLVEAAKDGYECCILLVVQMHDVRWFTPNYATHREFGEALRTAQENGVSVKAFDCVVTPDSIELDGPIEIRF